MSCWDVCVQSPWLLISVLLCDRGALWAHKAAQSCFKTEEFFWSYCFVRSWSSSLPLPLPLLPGLSCLIRFKKEWKPKLFAFLFPLGNLSAQSAPSVLPPQQTLHPPGSVPETGQNHLLQPLKPSPSSENLYSAFTSDGALSVPSLSAPGQGKTLNAISVISNGNEWLTSWHLLFNSWCKVALSSLCVEAGKDVVCSWISSFSLRWGVRWLKVWNPKANTESAVGWWQAEFCWPGEGCWLRGRETDENGGLEIRSETKEQAEQVWC